MEPVGLRNRRGGATAAKTAATLVESNAYDDSVLSGEEADQDRGITARDASFRSSSGAQPTGEDSGDDAASNCDGSEHDSNAYDEDVEEMQQDADHSDSGRDDDDDDSDSGPYGYAQGDAITSSEEEEKDEEEDDEDGGSDSDDENSGEGPGASGAPAAKRSPSKTPRKSPSKVSRDIAALQSDADDWKVLLSALGGMVICGPAAAVLPAKGFDQSHVMAAGLLSLLAVIVLANFCPRSCRRRIFPQFDDQNVPPLFIFWVTGSIGVMIGGLCGGALAYYVDT